MNDANQFRLLRERRFLQFFVAQARGAFNDNLFKNVLVQQRSRPQSLARVIGANSILNALFMVAAALLGAVGLARGLSVLQLILVAALLNALVAIYIYTLVPEFLLRFVCWLLVHTLYRMQKRGAHFPEEGAALLICNHSASWMPW